MRDAHWPACPRAFTITRRGEGRKGRPPAGGMAPLRSTYVPNTVSTAGPAACVWPSAPFEENTRSVFGEGANTSRMAPLYPSSPFPVPSPCAMRTSRAAGERSAWRKASRIARAMAGAAAPGGPSAAPKAPPYPAMPAV